MELLRLRGFDILETLCYGLFNSVKESGRGIIQNDPQQHLSHTSILSLLWLSTMEQYEQYCRMGIDMLATRYANWRSVPRKTAEAMLDYCQCSPGDMTAIYDTLTRDSQAGTVLSQKAVKQHNRGIDEHDLDVLN